MQEALSMPHPGLCPGLPCNGVSASLQGRTAPDRLQAIAGLRGAMAGALDLLGLQRDAPGVLLAELRALALVRRVPCVDYL